MHAGTGLGWGHRTGTARKEADGMGWRVISLSISGSIINAEHSNIASGTEQNQELVATPSLQYFSLDSSLSFLLPKPHLKLKVPQVLTDLPVDDKG